MLSSNRRQRWWMLLLALLFCATGGGLYFWQWFHGLRGHALLEFVTIYVAPLLAVGLVLMFAYIRRPRY
jgi:hypothetical protein